MSMISTSPIWDKIWSGLEKNGGAPGGLQPDIVSAAGKREPKPDLAKKTWLHFLSAENSSGGSVPLPLWHRGPKVWREGFIPTNSTGTNLLKGLCIGDLMWLYFYERMGIFSMLKRLIDDYHRQGRFPIDIASAEDLEEMTRLVQSGRASGARERAATYLRSLGWRCEGLQVPTAGVQANTSFDANWRSFFRNALAYYHSKNVSDIIGKAPVSGASAVAAGDAARSLWASFTPFETSSNCSATHYGVAWVLGALRLFDCDNIKNCLGISKSTKGSAAICAAYEVLILGQPPRGTDLSRYTVHNACATYGQRLLLDLQGLKNEEDSITSDDLKSWFNESETEDNIEGFSSAWQRLTGEDLGATAPVSSSR